jgi:hypothetical protein
MRAQQTKEKTKMPTITKNFPMPTKKEHSNVAPATPLDMADFAMRLRFLPFIVVMIGRDGARAILAAFGHGSDAFAYVCTVASYLDASQGADYLPHVLHNKNGAYIGFANSNGDRVCVQNAYSNEEELDEAQTRGFIKCITSVSEQTYYVNMPNGAEVANKHIGGMEDQPIEFEA